MKHIKLFEGFSSTDLSETLGNEYHLHKFIDKPDFQYYLSPGPMKISQDNPHEDYSFNVKKVSGTYRFQIPTEEQIAQSKEGRKQTLSGIKSGNTVWWVPGGYHF
jgi:hypothetical protein